MRSIFCLLTVFWLRGTLSITIIDNYFPQAFICSRCKNSSNEAFTTDIKNRLKLVDGYFDNVEEPIFCSDIINKLVPKMKQITVDIQPCFTNNETYLPNFIYEGFADFVEFLCGNRTIEIFFSDQGRDCRQALVEYQDGEKITNCSCQLSKVYENDVLTYDHLCFELKSAEKCFDEAIADGCPHFAAFRLLNSKFFRAIGALCNHAASYLSNSVLIISVVLGLRFIATNIN